MSEVLSASWKARTVAISEVLMSSQSTGLERWAGQPGVPDRLITEDLKAEIGGTAASDDRQQQVTGRAAQRHGGLGVPMFEPDAVCPAEDGPLAVRAEAGIGGMQVQ